MAALTASAIAAASADYSDFAALSEEKKDRLVWELHERHEWGSPDQKPICRDLLANQGYRFANAIAWTTDAIDLAEKQGWSDLNPLISKIYQSPRNIWLYERAFRHVRSQDGRPVSSNLVEEVETLRRAGYYRSTVTDEQLANAKQRLMQNSDKEAVLVYTLGVACWHAGKGGTDRGRQAAVEILLGLRREDVVGRLRQLHRDGENYMRHEIEWVMKHLSADIGNNTPNQASQAIGASAPQPER